MNIICFLFGHDDVYELKENGSTDSRRIKCPRCKRRLIKVGKEWREEKIEEKK